ncbi:hypothetical protein QVM62_18480 [Pseudomonas putida]|uniref:hypothetical protein n=1 Tax=Pseudomonas TaxID=286 RepID=UPI0035255E08
MAIADLFRLRMYSLAQRDPPHFQIYSCLQWKGRNLEMMPQLAEQRFCLMYNVFLDEHLITALERAYARGLMSPVKLIALHDNDMRMFLDTRTSSNTAATMEELWMDFTDLDATRRFSVAFASEDEILSGRSDYPYQDAARVLLERSSLGLEPCDFPDLEPFDPASFSPDDQWSFMHPPEGI